MTYLYDGLLLTSEYSNTGTGDDRYRASPLRHWSWVNNGENIIFDSLHGTTSVTAHFPVTISTSRWMLWKETFFCCKNNNSDCQVNDPLYSKTFAKLPLPQLLGLLGCFWSELAEPQLGGQGVWPHAPAAAFALVLAFECTVSWLTLQKWQKIWVWQKRE